MAEDLDDHRRIFDGGGGSDNKIQIGRNIRQLPQFVNV
jgi:hypothetical protein